MLRERIATPRQHVRRNKTCVIVRILVLDNTEGRHLKIRASLCVHPGSCRGNNVQPYRPLNLLSGFVNGEARDLAAVLRQL